LSYPTPQCHKLIEASGICDPTFRWSVQSSIASCKLVPRRQRKGIWCAVCVHGSFLLNFPWRLTPGHACLAFRVCRLSSCGADVPCVGAQNKDHDILVVRSILFFIYMYILKRIPFSLLSRCQRSSLFFSRVEATATSILQLTSCLDPNANKVKMLNFSSRVSK
jgi:hypothetical protein